MKLSFIIIAICIMYGVSHAQNDAVKNSDIQKYKLLNFASEKSKSFIDKNNRAQLLAKKYGLNIIEPTRNGGVIILQYFINGKPVYFNTDNINASNTVSANLLWPDVDSAFSLNGNLIEVGLWDGGKVYQEHQEFVVNPEKIWQRDNPSFSLNHSTHVAGTIKAAGVDSLSKGIASDAKILAYDFNNNISEMAVAASENLLLSNHSYGKICGWSYNASNEYWFWYGDVSLDQDKDVDFGYYDSICWDLDYITYNAPNFLIVKSAGNDRGEGPSEQPLTHYDWNDGWVKENDTHAIDGGESGYQTVSSMAVSKNSLVVGAVNDLPNGYTDAESVDIELYSSWGPTSDGRIKPDVVANGSGVYSCIASGESDYISYSGTSMAAANATGVIALLLQLQQQLQPEIYLRSSTVKGLLIQTADECGESDGPDYKYGYGLINAFKAANLLKKNVDSGGEMITEDLVISDDCNIYQIEVGENTEQLKITLCWTDLPGTVDNQLEENVTPNLVNDLDVTLADDQGNIYYPWILDPLNPDGAAIHGVNYLDNVEQIVLNNPLPGVYQIKVNGAKISAGSSQSFSLICDGQVVNSGIQPPKNLGYRLEEGAMKLIWNAPDIKPVNYKIYLNHQYFNQCEDTCFIIADLQDGIDYQLFITANYLKEKIQESLPSNTINVSITEEKYIPYLTTFDEGKEGWIIKEEKTGWRWGNRDSLTSYYLRFDENETPFLWIDSGIMSGSIHVSDKAISPPVDLSNVENIRLSFDYILMTETYGVIDDLFVLCRQAGDENWTTIAELGQSSKWKSYELTIPPEFAKSNIQIAFYYDDYYQRGMGAAIDNINLVADIVTDIVNNEDKPEIRIYNNMIELNSIDVNTTNFNWSVYDLLGRKIQEGNGNLLEGRAIFHIGNRKKQVVILRLQFGGQMYFYKLLLQ
ncbi:S8 family serine peptidase [Carboxylicivirga caseinilyticus]|uniref:S8 family serine peptidase n=1 Tax=Carboxylicivirga caseinilyticus TaxID=3417572 RepID=UPI003D3430C6|nr:S8 family serine peptidase [Marinilabiliaceae bacterium A049]